MDKPDIFMRIVMLPTTDASRLHYLTANPPDDSPNWTTFKWMENPIGNRKHMVEYDPQFLYMVDNFEGCRNRLRKNDWFIFFGDNNTELHQFHSDSGYGIKTLTNYDSNDESSVLLSASKCSGRIVATNDPSLELPFIPEEWIVNTYIPNHGKIDKIQLEVGNFSYKNFHDLNTIFTVADKSMVEIFIPTKTRVLKSDLKWYPGVKVLTATKKTISILDTFIRCGTCLGTRSIISVQNPFSKISCPTCNGGGSISTKSESEKFINNPEEYIEKTRDAKPIKTTRQLAKESFDTMIFVGDDAYKNIAWHFWKMVFDKAETVFKELSLNSVEKTIDLCTENFKWTDSDMRNAYRAGKANGIDRENERKFNGELAADNENKTAVEWLKHYKHNDG